MKNYPEWIVIILGVLLIVSGYRAVTTGEARTDAEFDDRHGAAAVRLGWVWIVMGGAFLAAAIFDINPLKGLVQFFLKYE